jgi:3-oxoacyl-[acyl-carrier-protein] synthase-1
MTRDARGTGALVTGIGLCSSLGDAVTAAAAARAGLSRPAELELEIEDDDTGETAPLTGHPVPALEKFLGRARVIALAEQALADLAARDPELPSLPDCGLCLCVTDGDTRRWLPDQPPSTTEVREQQRADARARQELATDIVQLADLPVEPHMRRVYPGGAGGFAAAVDDALAGFRAGQLGACLVGAVDSLIEASALRFLYEAGRLKTPDDATGLIPGEAAAFLLLERPDRARQRHRAALARIAGTAQEQGEDPDVVERPPRGTALLGMMARLFAGAPPGPAWVLTDQNGETFWAHEWGDFVVRAASRLPGFQVGPLWYPAVSFGDTGAASGALAACLAVRAFARGYAPAPLATVISSTYEGRRGAVQLAAPFEER